MAAINPIHPGLLVRGTVRTNPPLPYTPSPFPGELLSSWLKRIAAEYRISLAYLAQYLGLSAVSATLLDSSLYEADIQRIATSTRSNPADIRKMVRRPLRRPVRNLVASQGPIQYCRECRACHAKATTEPVAIMTWFEFWHIECLHCHVPFSSNTKADLRRCNPAREHPEWFSKIIPIATAGGQRLASFARQPSRIPLSPTAVLNLLSMRLNTGMASVNFAAGPGARSWGHYHCVAELFVPGLQELLSENHLVPEIWTSRRPVRLVTARTILLAAMAAFFADARCGFKRITNSASAAMMVVVDRWFNALPTVSREWLAKAH